MNKKLTWLKSKTWSTGLGSGYGQAAGGWGAGGSLYDRCEDYSASTLQTKGGCQGFGDSRAGDNEGILDHFETLLLVCS